MLTVVTVQESAEQMFHLFWRNTVTCITHLDLDLIIILIGQRLDCHLASLFGVFGGIREQIVDNLVQFVGIYPSHHTLRLTENGEFHLLFGDEGLQTLGRLMDVLHHITLGHKQFQLSGLRLAGFEDLLEQAHHSLDVQLHEVVVAAIIWYFFT